jgi:hypothetical protein
LSHDAYKRDRAIAVDGLQSVALWGEGEDQMSTINFKDNAEKLAKELDFVGHGGYEEQATVDGDYVYCSCAHCGSAYHQFIKVFSLEPLKVTIGSYTDYGHEEKHIEEFESVDALRLSVEDTMAGC